MDSERLKQIINPLEKGLIYFKFERENEPIIEDNCISCSFKREDIRLDYLLRVMNDTFFAKMCDTELELRVRLHNDDRIIELYNNYVKEQKNAVIIIRNLYRSKIRDILGYLSYHNIITV